MDPPTMDGGAGRESERLADASRLALALLTRRERSRDELIRALIARGTSPDDAETMVAQLSERGWQDDDRFAGALARTRAAAGYGPERIRYELSRHGIDELASADALASCEADWRARAEALLARRYRADALVDPAVRAKAIAFLVRRGFDLQTARAAIADVMQSDSD